MDRPLEEPPHVTFEALEVHSAGLIALTGAGEGALVRHLAEGQPDAAYSLRRPAQPDLQGADLCGDARRLDADEGSAEADLIELADRLDLPLVATNPAAFAEADFHDAHDAMTCIANSAMSTVPNGHAARLMHGSNPRAT